MPAPDTTLSDRYRLERFIARGGMADVYAGTDLTLERPVAVKVLHALADADTARFVDEMLALSRLNHPAIVRLFDAGEHEGARYLVMELVSGQSLRERIAAGPLESAATARIALTVARALDHAHGHGIVHRDVKPANILLDAGGAARLADFGIARTADGTRGTATGATLGTAGYLAPEQVAGQAVGPPTDIYALGLVLLEALTGRKEYPGSAVEAAVARLHRDPGIPSSLGPAWRDLLARMTARQPEGRPSAANVVHALGAGTLHDWTAADAEQSLKASVTTLLPVQELDEPTAPIPDGTSPARRNRSAAVALALALVVAGVGVTGQIRGSEGGISGRAAAAEGAVGPDAEKLAHLRAAPAVTPATTPTPAPDAAGPVTAEAKTKTKRDAPSRGTNNRGQAKGKGKGR